MDTASLNKRHVLVVGGKPGNTKLLRGLLASLGIDDIAIADSSAAANDALANDTYDVIICDETMGPANAVAFAMTLRRSIGAKNRRTPMLLVLERSLVRRVELARDAGIDGIVLRPFSLLAVKRKLMAVLFRPRPFINLNGYAGPDRRHKIRRRPAEPVPAKGGKERRTRSRGRRKTDLAAS